MKRKTLPSEMQAVRQRQYPLPNSDLGFTNAIPRSTEFDLHPEPRGWCGVNEFSFVQDKPGGDIFEKPKPNPGNAMWEEKNRP